MSASDLARRWAALVASGRVRWLPGMHTARGLCVVLVGGRSGRMVLQDGYGIDDDDVPDWDHHGTTGGLLALVRLAWGDDAAYVAIDGQCFVLRGRGGYLTREGGRYVSEHRSEVECLLAGLEAAPKGAT